MRLTGKLTNEVQNHTLKIWQIQCVCVCVCIYYTVKMGGNCKPLSNTFMSSFYQHLTPFLMHFVLRLVLHVDKVLPKRVNLIKAHTTLNPGPMKLSCIHIIGTFSISGSANPDDVIKWKHFPCNLTLVWRIHRSPVNSPHKGQWHGALMFSLICAWNNSWANNGDAGDLRRHRAHFDVIVMSSHAPPQIENWQGCARVHMHTVVVLCQITWW